MSRYVPAFMASADFLRLPGKQNPHEEEQDPSDRYLPFPQSGACTSVSPGVTLFRSKRQTRQISLSLVPRTENTEFPGVSRRLNPRLYYLSPLATLTRFSEDFFSIPCVQNHAKGVMIL